MKLRQTMSAVLATALVGTLHTANVGAQDVYPNRPVRMIVPTAAGGSTDVLIRALGKEFTDRTGQAMVIENRTGANTIIAAEACAKAIPDGYTLCVLPNTTIALNPSLYDKLPYDSVKSFTPITNLATGQQVLVVNPSVPAQSFRELVDYSKKHPNRLNFASSGIGSNVHLTLETLWRQSGADITHVPFKAASEAPLAFLRGDVQVMYLIIGNPGVMDQINAGQSRPLLVSGDTRSPLLPNVPTFTEAGFAKMDSPTWFGLFAPAGVPADIVAKLYAHISAILTSQRFSQTYLAPASFQSSPNTPVEFAKFLDDERSRGALMVKASGVHLKN